MLRQQPQLRVAVDELMVTRATHDAFASLVGVDLKTIFSNRACIMGSPPHFLRGAYRAAMRFALEEVELGVDAQNEQRICLGWKLFLLLSRMLLHKPARGGLVLKRKLMERFVAFTRGEWIELLITSRDCAEAAAQGRKRRQRTFQGDSVERRAERAEQLVQRGELSFSFGRGSRGTRE